MKVQVSPISLLRLIVASIDMGKADNAKAIAEDAIKQLESAEQPSTEDEI